MGWEHAPEVNVPDVALIFEGGGMRCAYSAGIVNTLSESGIHFGHVYGLSAGASTSGNYLGGDTEYARASFVDLGKTKESGNWGLWLRHKGFFNVERIYQPGIMPGGAGPSPYKEIVANPSQMTIVTFARDTGETIAFTKDDFDTAENMMLRIRASSTMPILMPPPTVDGTVCYDGGLGEGAGIMLPQARRDGFKRFFIVRTRPEGYRKEPQSLMWLFKLFFWRRPKVGEALANRHERYNAVCDELDALVEQGAAFQVYAEDSTLSSSTLEYDELERNYQAGYAQAQRQVGEWKRWLGLED